MDITARRRDHLLRRAAVPPFNAGGALSIKAVAMSAMGRKRTLNVKHAGDREAAMTRTAALNSYYYPDEVGIG